MDTKQKDKTIKIAISLEHNERLNSFLSMIKKEQSHSLMTKQKLVELAIEKIKESDALSLSYKFTNRKKALLDLIKLQDNNLSNFDEMITRFKKKTSKIDS